MGNPTICGIDTRRATKSGRFYEILPPPAPPYPSVTTILQIIAKAALMHWSAKVERIACMETAADLFEEFSKPLVISTGMTREVYKSLFEARLGKKKAHVKEKEAAGDIGSGTHAYIEWHVRQMLKLPAGPAPKVPEESLIGFMSFEDCAREIALEPIRSEQVVFSHQHQYAGTMDLLAHVTMGGKRSIALIDFKTGRSVYSESFLQLCAYRHALIEMGLETAERLFVMRLPKTLADPEFEVVEVHDFDRHMQAFIHARQLWQWHYDMDSYQKQSKE